MFKVKKINLIEIIISIFIVSVLFNIITVEISYTKQNAFKSSTIGNERNMQTIIDRYYVENRSTYPTRNIPTEFIPQPIFVSKLYPKYLKSNIDIESSFYWVDFSGKVWVAPIDAPTGIITDITGKVTWEKVENADSYNIYSINTVEPIISGKVNQTAILRKIGSTKELNFQGEKKTTYLVSALTKEGLETVPVGTGYSGFSYENRPPINPLINIKVIERKQDYSIIDLKAYGGIDPDGDKVTYEWRNKHEDMIYYNGTYSVSLRAIDHLGLASDWVEYTFTTDSPMKTMFYNWTNYLNAGYHHTTPEESGEWTYDENNDWISSTKNVGWTGFWNPKDIVLQNYRLNFDMAQTPSAGDDDGIGFSFRMSDENNMYFFVLDNGNTSSNGLERIYVDGIYLDSGLFKMVDDHVVRLVDLSSYKWEPNIWQHITIELRGDNIKIWLDGTKVADFTDANNPLLEGGYGPFTISQANGAFKNLELDVFE